jgi:sphingomyelin phosphodiesterase acid-like 3
MAPYPSGKNGILHIVGSQENSPIQSGPGEMRMMSFRRWSKIRFMHYSILLLATAILVRASAANENIAVGGRTKASTKTTVSALLLSDIHFEPFWDPGKIAQLAAAPAKEWKTVLAAHASPDQQQRFASLQQTCHARGTDTQYALWASSLAAMRARAADASFITISGDVIAHAFSCKYKTLFPNASEDDYRGFVAKTIAYVLSDLRSSFPGIPVYAALGNNDSGCGDYRLDPSSAFLASISDTITEGFPAAERGSAKKSLATGGFYSVSLPFKHTQLLVLDDLFMSRKYRTCADNEDSAPAAAQLTWLREELLKARRAHEKVWVMGHIPPGIDPHATAVKMTNVCGGKVPEMFLSSDRLADTLAEFGDIIQLGIFAHTHMDEVRLLKPESNSASSVSRQDVAIKMISSISPIDGNRPSFTVAVVDPSTAILRDYRVFTASDANGAQTVWTEEYDFAQTYHEPDFSSSTVKTLIEGFRTDPGAETEASKSYIKNYFLRDQSFELRPFWSQYVCALSNHSADSYRECACATSH